MLRYYQASIWAPILLPGLLWGGASLFGVPTWEPLGLVLGTLYMSLYMGGVPYAALAIWATWRVRTMPEPAIRRLALWAPLLMLGVFLPYALAAGAEDGDVWAGFGFFLFCALYIVPIGYAYVGAVFGVRWAWKARRSVGGTGAGDPTIATGERHW